MEKVVEVKNLCVEFVSDDVDADRCVTAVTDVSFDLYRGEILGIVGESGSGKSVTCLSMLRLIPEPSGHISSGKILFDGEDLLQLSVRDLRRIRGDRIAMIFQEPMTALSPLRRIGVQLADVLCLHRKMSRCDAMCLAEDWLRRVGIPSPKEKMLSYPYELSGGQCQRVMIAMALILEPDVIIADEPTTALDVTIQAQIFDLIRSLKSDNTSMILVTHDMGVINEMCDRVLVMYASEIVEVAEKKELFSNPRHPYTMALLRSIPDLYNRVEELKAIPGQVPVPVGYGEYCRFKNRCGFAEDVCGSRHPELENGVRCFLADKL